jgi:glucose-1-phosphate cytidylyltransferase
MKVVILAGGLGTRISEETHLKPKPMIEIGGMPILWHLMKIYSYYGFNEFIICCGYKGYLIKEFFANYFLHMSDITFDIKNNSSIIHSKNVEPWLVTLVDTGTETMTGGRIKRIASYLNQDEPFMLTYGDGLSDINLKNLLSFYHRKQSKATITGVTPPGRFGALSCKDDFVTTFNEKPLGDGSVINGGFFVIDPSAIDLIKDDKSIWEKEPLESLTNSKDLTVYKHNGFWQPMDTLRDKNLLESLWQSGRAPWKVW